MDYVHDLKSFYQHLICFLSVNAGLTVLNLLFAPDHFWAKWVTAFWGLWLFVHAVATFEVVNIFARGWEHRAAQKRLRRL
ncbi:MAG: 2TM domain-containing protein [Planctomycetes bacterium]|nr:2TM domain-containing protein [Planctomycetota bacterium]